MQLIENLEHFNLSNRRLDFPPFELEILSTKECIGRNGQGWVCVNGYLEIDCDGRLTRQSVAVSILFLEDESRPPEIIRRFHFDYERQIAERSSHHWPHTHFQYGGKFNDRHYPDHWQGADPCPFPKADLPRFLCHPSDFMVTLDTVFSLYGNAEDHKLQSDGTWGAALQSAEETFLKPYFDTLSGRMPVRGESYFTFLAEKSLIIQIL